MPTTQDFDSITPTQYSQYSTTWVELINTGDDRAIQLAFRAPGGEQINFSAFSINQIRSLVSTAGVAFIKARFLLMPDATGQARFSVTLFAVDATGNRLSEYYIPTVAAATATEEAAPLNEPNTQIPRKIALGWLTDWVNASALTAALFTTPHGPMHGYNFEVSTFQDPLAEAQPYADKCLFLNYGLSTEAEATLIALVVYIDRIGSRTQGNLEGVPDGDVFYDLGDVCPPSH